MEVLKNYTAHVDELKRVTIQGASYQYYDVKLNNRRLQIAKGFKVPSINITDLLENDYKYNKEYDFYERV